MGGRARCGAESRPRPGRWAGRLREPTTKSPPPRTDHPEPTTQNSQPVSRATLVGCPQGRASEAAIPFHASSEVVTVALAVGDYLERTVRGVWQHHFRIPEPAYWAVLTIAALVTPFSGAGPQSIVGLVIVALSITGIARWHRDRRRCRNALVVARFREGGGTAGRADEAQRIVTDSLRDALSPAEASLVQTIPVTISGDERAFAAQTMRRLRARFVLHGRISTSSEGSGWSVLPKLLEPSSGLVFHQDPFTRDITTMRPSFDPVFSSLRAERGVRDDEFPFEFCQDLKALVRALAGVLSHAVGAEERAIALLRRALKANPQSTSHAADGLRVALARSLMAAGKDPEALEVFRRRLRHPDPSPHLLRSFAFAAWEAAWSGQLSDQESAKLHGDAVRALRDAVEHRDDPEWDMSAFNLMSNAPASLGNSYAAYGQAQRSSHMAKRRQSPRFV